jgi:hypothetical protein
LKTKHGKSSLVGVFRRVHRVGITAVVGAAQKNVLIQLIIGIPVCVEAGFDLGQGSHFFCPGSPVPVLFVFYAKEGRFALTYIKKHGQNESEWKNTQADE